MELHVFRSFQWCVEIEIRYVHHHEFRFPCGYDTVQEDFGIQHVCSWCGDFTRVIDFVATNNKSRSVWFLLFRVHGTYERAISDIAPTICGHSRFGDELDGVGTFDPATNSVGKASEFIGRGEGPVGMVFRVANQLSVVEHFSGGLIHDCERPVHFVFKPFDSFGKLGWSWLLML